MRFPYFLGRPRFPVGAGGSSYMAVSTRALQMMPRFPNSLMSPATSAFGYQLSHSRNTCLEEPITPIACRTISAAVSSLLFPYPRAGIPGEPTGTGSARPLKPGRTAGCLPYNGRSGNWSHYVQHGQRVLSRVQTFCRISLPWCHQWTGTGAGFQGNLEPL